MSHRRSRLARAVVGLTLAVGALVGTTALTSTGSADAAALPCVTKAEFRQIRKGMTPARVTNLTGVKGRVSSSFNFGGYRSLSKEYRACVGRPYSFVSVGYSADPGQPLKMNSKFAYWG
jgi:hypothetical protein